MSTQKAVAVSKQTWLPPAKASLPKIYMVTPSMATKTNIGTKDNKGDGMGLFFIMN
jgi:hypothetical protein